MTRLRGWAPRGQRLVDKVPQGKWKTATFLATLRNDRIDAPCLFDGPINGERFHAYVELSGCCIETKLYWIKTGLVTASPMWYVAIAVIVGGHVVAVYLAHTQALRLFPDRVRGASGPSSFGRVDDCLHNVELVDSRATHHQRSTLTRAAWPLPIADGGRRGAWQR